MIEILEDLGLTKGEIKVYTALLEAGTSTAGPIIDLSGLQNSVVHLCLNSLAKKGLLSYIQDGKNRYYTAADPDYLLKYVDAKRAKLKSILPELKAKQTPVIRQEAHVYQGFKGLKQMNYFMLEHAKAGDTFYFFSFYPENPEEHQNIYEFYKEFDQDRKTKGVKVQGLAPENLRKVLSKRTYAKVRYATYPIPLNISILGDMVAFTDFEGQQSCFLIISDDIAENFRNYFRSVWKNAKD